MKKVTMTELAAMVGCSHSTVSRALSGSGRISAETREKILKFSDRHHYQPQRGWRVAAVIWTVADFAPDYYMLMLVQHLTLELHRRKFRFFIVPGYDMSLLDNLYITGAISLSPFNRIARRWSAVRPTPMVTVNDYSETVGGIFSVTSNEEDTVETVVDMLIAHGCSKPLFVLLSADTLCSKLRLEAYRRSMERYGLSAMVVNYGKNIDVETWDLPECDSFILAGENLESISSVLHRRFPEKRIAVWRFGDEVNPGEITVNQDFARLAAEAVDLLECAISNPAAAGNRKVPSVIKSGL